MEVDVVRPQERGERTYGGEEKSHTRILSNLGKGSTLEFKKEARQTEQA